MASPAIRTRRSVFVDSSVFFAASYSAAGSAHDLFVAAIRGSVSLILSGYVLTETRRNLQGSAPHALPAFDRLLGSAPFRLQNPSARLIADTARIIVAKDAPIIAAARSARVKLVATYDRKDLLSKGDAILAEYGITVATPDDVLRMLDLR